jgi:hypothetical protein
MTIAEAEQMTITELHEWSAYFRLKQEQEKHGSAQDNFNGSK